MRSLDWLTPEQRYAIAQRYLDLAIAMSLDVDEIFDLAESFT